MGQERLSALATNELAACVKGSTDKPPFVDCCLFTSAADGMPTSFELGPTRVLPDGRYHIMVDFVRKESADVIKWRDAVIVMKDGDHFAIDDVISDADTASRDAGLLSSKSFQGCRGRQWIGGLWRGELLEYLASPARLEDVGEAAHFGTSPAGFGRLWTADVHRRVTLAA